MKKCLVVLILALLIFGCAGGGGQQQPPSSNQTLPPPVIPPPPKPSPFPMKLTYVMQEERWNGERRWNQSIEIVYWLEDEKKCNGRDSVLGILAMRELGGGNTGQPLAKITVYLDKGELTVSNWQQESDLSFDTAKPQASEMDFMLFMNYIFNGADKNFMNNPVWNSTEPVILKEVTAFGSISNISVVKVGESASGVVPCTEFSVAVKGSTGYSEQLKACVAHITDSNPLPYIVYVKPKEGESGANWKLNSVDKVKSDIAKYPQCLSPIVCPKVKSPTQQEWNTCNQQGGSIEQVRDNDNCIVEYKCMSMREVAERDLKNMQGPDCVVSQEVINALVACREQNKQNIDFERGNQGCITGIVCP